MSFDNREFFGQAPSSSAGGKEESSALRKSYDGLHKRKSVHGLVGKVEEIDTPMNSRRYNARLTKSHLDLHDEHSEMGEEPSFKKDKYNIALLFFLYILQGVPLGLSAAVPMLLQNRGISYTEQAKFSLVFWPFSLKLLWAPIVDYMFVERWGRRKTWLIPTQYLIGLFMMMLSMRVNDWLGSESAAPNIMYITLFFFLLNFLAATQDIAVDGWALTMLKRCNVGYSSTCNSVGQTVGYFLGYVVFMALESADFCNSYLRAESSPKGMVTLQSYLFLWSCIFMISTSLVAIFKQEGTPIVVGSGRRRNSLIRFNMENSSDQFTPANLKESYLILLSIIKLRPIYTLAAILLTAKIGFAACDGVTQLKLMEGGIPKEKMAMLAVPIVPLQMVLPLLISKYTIGRNPMNVYIKAYPYRLAMNVVIALTVWSMPKVIGNGPDQSVPTYFSVFLVVTYCLEQITVYSMFVATMAFFARISDPAVGGTYMTLLNTLSNLGSSWSTTTALWLVDHLTYKYCTKDGYGCGTPDEATLCTNAKGKCVTMVDGYFIESIICTVFGVLWFLWARRKILYLQSLGNMAWLREWTSSRNDDNSRRQR